MFFGFQDEEISPPSPDEAGWLYVLPQADKSGLLHSFWQWYPSSRDAVRLQGFFSFLRNNEKKKGKQKKKLVFYGK